jgi:RNA polymerase sigma-70 factor (ECF subfamily)
MITHRGHIDPTVITPATAPPATDEWTLLVARIRQGDPNALTELYQIFGRGVRLLMFRQLGPQDIDDRVHDAFLAVLQAIQKGGLRDSARLMGLVHTIVRRKIATHINHLVQARRQQVALEQGPEIPDRNDTPEDHAMGHQQVNLMVKVLRDMTSRDCDILTRFYLHDQAQDQICREMDLRRRNIVFSSPVRKRDSATWAVVRSPRLSGFLIKP